MNITNRVGFCEFQPIPETLCFTHDQSLTFLFQNFRLNKPRGENKPLRSAFDSEPLAPRKSKCIDKSYLQWKLIPEASFGQITFSMSEPTLTHLHFSNPFLTQPKPLVKSRIETHSDPLLDFRTYYHVTLLFHFVIHTQ